MTLVYLCGAISGLSYDAARNGWRKEFADLLHPSIAPLSPMRQEGHLSEVKNIDSHGYDHNQMSTDKGIFFKDKLDVKRADLVVCNFLGAQRVSIGSVFELGWADAWGKPIVLIMEPFIKGSKCNLHDHAFITEAAQFYAHSVQEAADYTNALLTSGV